MKTAEFAGDTGSLSSSCTLCLRGLVQFLWPLPSFAVTFSYRGITRALGLLLQTGGHRSHSSKGSVYQNKSRIFTRK